MKEVLKLKRKWLLLCIPASILIILVCRASSFIAEYVFGRFIYRIFAIVVGAVTRWLPFSLAEIIIYILAISCIVLPVWYIIHIIRGKGRRSYIALKGLLNLLCFVSVAVFLFVVMCGTNYYRYSF